MPQHNWECHTVPDKFPERLIISEYEHYQGGVATPLSHSQIPLQVMTVCQWLLRMWWEWELQEHVQHNPSVTYTGLTLAATLYNGQFSNFNCMQTILKDPNLADIW